MQWEKSRLSHHLARMERRGLIERQDCEDDARGAFVALTPEGRRAIEQACSPARRDRPFGPMFDGLDADEVETLAHIAEVVLGRIGR